MHYTRWTALALVGGALFLAGCGAGSTDDSASEPAKVEEVAGHTQVVLSGQAAERLGVETTRIRSGAGSRKVIPFGAVLYDSDGRTWTYTNPKPLVFVRQDISVDHIDGNRAFLSAGPPAGTAVVTVGATEIWGVEYGGIEED